MLKYCCSLVAIFLGFRTLPKNNRSTGVSHTPLSSTNRSELLSSRVFISDDTLSLVVPGATSSHRKIFDRLLVVMLVRLTPVTELICQLSQPIIEFINIYPGQSDTVTATGPDMIKCIPYLAANLYACDLPCHSSYLVPFGEDADGIICTLYSKP